MANDVKIIISADGSGVKVVTDGVVQNIAKIGTSATQASATAQTALQGISNKLQSMENLAKGYLGLQLLQAQAFAEGILFLSPNRSVF